MTRDEATKVLAQALFKSELDTVSRTVLTDPRLFAKLMVNAIRIMRPQDKVEQSEDMALRVTTTGSPVKSLRLRLDRMFDSLIPRDDVGNGIGIIMILESVEESINTAFGAISERPDDHDIRVAVPLVKPRHYIDHIVQRAAKDSAGTSTPLNRHLLVHWETSNGLLAVAAVDTPKTYAFVTETAAEKAGLNHDGMVALAMENLRKAYVASGFESDYEGGLCEFSDIGGAAASLVLLDEFLPAESEKAGEGLFVHAFDADRLILVPMSNKSEILTLMAAVKAGAAPSRVEMPQMFFTDGAIREVTLADVKAMVTDEMAAVKEFIGRGTPH